jgi:hypothetical protein
VSDNPERMALNSCILLTQTQTNQRVIHRPDCGFHYLKRAHPVNHIPQQPNGLQYL